MASVYRFEDLLAWQHARRLTHLIYKLSRCTPLSTDFGLKDQIRRAAVSVMSNIAEGFGYKSDKQFLRYLDIARASLCEVQSLSYVILDAELLDGESCQKIQDLSRKTVSLIAALQKSLRSTPSR